MRKRLPLVSEDVFARIGIASPCDADWDRMKGDDRVRHCGHCRQNVYDLSAMTTREAQALIAAREGRLCIRLLRRADGTVVTADCREKLREARRRGRVAFAVALVVFCVTQIAIRVAGGYALWSWFRPHVPFAERRMMGDMIVPPTAVADSTVPPAPSPPPHVPVPKPGTVPHRTMGKMVIHPSAPLSAHDPLGGID